MLSRGGASAGVAGSSNALCAVKREGLLASESNTLNTSASFRVHLREVEPLVRRVVRDVIDLAGAVLVAPLDQDEALLRDAAAIADAERIDHHRCRGSAATPG